MTITYWDANWDELEHLRIEEATPMAATLALGSWLEYQAICNATPFDPDHPLSDVHAVTLEVARG